MAFSGKMSSLGDGNPTFYTTGFMALLESILVDLSDLTTNQSIAIDRNIALSCRGDFHRLLTKNLNDNGLPRQYWWITTRINGMYSPEDYTGESSHIILPDIAYLDSLATKYNATQSTGQR